MTDTEIGAALRKELGLLTEAEVAAIAEVETKTVTNWRTNRYGPPFTKMGKAVIYRREAVLRWLEQHEKETE